jgi:hypothetical protein
MNIWGVNEFRRGGVSKGKLKGHSFVILIGMKEGKFCEGMDSEVTDSLKLGSWPPI